MAATVAVIPQSGSVAAQKFYRRELDALRFFAFLAVYISHSVPNDWANIAWHDDIFRAIVVLKDAGNFGVCLFFLLSGFLITKLLCCEKQRWGTIHIRAFYMRRILRIWPLYFGITVFYALGGFFLHSLRLETGRIVAYFLFVGNWYLVAHPWLKTPLRALWSISVEEQFYLLWPWLARLLTPKKIVFVSVALVFLSSFAIMPAATATSYAQERAWLSSPVQIQFFAWGALLTIAFEQQEWRPTYIVRSLWWGAGMICWIIAAAMGIKRPGVNLTPLAYCLGYLLIAAGCVMIFLGALHLNKRFIPRWMAFLGKISFGLYVFHETAFMMVDKAIKVLPGCNAWTARHVLATFVLNKSTALIVTVFLACISYHLWEIPFLRLKKRFTFVVSRSV